MFALFVWPIRSMWQRVTPPQSGDNERMKEEGRRGGGKEGEEKVSREERKQNQEEEERVEHEFRRPTLLALSSLHYFCPAFLSPPIVFARLCPFRSISRPPICCCPPHPSLPAPRVCHPPSPLFPAPRATSALALSLCARPALLACP